MPDYDGSIITVPEGLTAKIEERFYQFLSIILKEVKPEPRRNNPDLNDLEKNPHLFFGLGGQALTFLQIYENFKGINDTLSQEAIQLAKSYIDAAVQDTVED